MQKDSRAFVNSPFSPHQKTINRNTHQGQKTIMTIQAITKLLIAFRFCGKLINRRRALSLLFTLSCISLVISQTHEAKLANMTETHNGAMTVPETRPSPLRRPVIINKCPVQLAQLLPLRGFRLGSSLAEFAKRFQGEPTSIPEPDYLGIRSMKFNWAQESRRLTDLKQMEFRFFNDHLYQIEATYKVGTEWEERPLSEFAEAISQGMGVEAAWAEMPDKRFRLDCGEVRFNLWVMEPMMSRSSLPAGEMAAAFLTLTATGSEAQIKKRAEAFRQQQQQRNTERRRVFTP
jgi:hypothetical protein